jgi:hypothetical protein
MLEIPPSPLSDRRQQEGLVPARLPRTFLLIRIHPDQTDARRLIPPDRLPEWITTFFVMKAPGCTVLHDKGCRMRDAFGPPRGPLLGHVRRDQWREARG